MNSDKYCCRLDRLKTIIVEKRLELDNLRITELIHFSVAVGTSKFIHIYKYMTETRRADQCIRPPRLIRSSRFRHIFINVNISVERIDQNFEVPTAIEKRTNSIIRRLFNLFSIFFIFGHLFLFVIIFL